MGKDDILPRRNLPGEAEQWGRAIESNISEIWTGLTASDQSRGNANRSFQGSLALIQDQISFLVNQVTSHIGTGVWDNQVDTSGTGAWQWYDFDPTYDLSDTFTTSSSGKIIVDVNAQVVLNNNTLYQWADVCCGYDILDGVNATVQADLTRSARLGGINAGGLIMTASGWGAHSLSPNTTYTIRSRRAARYPTAPDTSWAGVRLPRINITRLR